MGTVMTWLHRGRARLKSVLEGAPHMSADRRADPLARLLRLLPALEPSAHFRAAARRRYLEALEVRARREVLVGPRRRARGLAVIAALVGTTTEPAGLVAWLAGAAADLARWTIATGVILALVPEVVWIPASWAPAACVLTLVLIARAGRWQSRNKPRARSYSQRREIEHERSQLVVVLALVLLSGLAGAATADNRWLDGRLPDTTPAVSIDQPHGTVLDALSALDQADGLEPRRHRARGCGDPYARPPGIEASRRRGARPDPRSGRPPSLVQRRRAARAGGHRDRGSLEIHGESGGVSGAAAGERARGVRPISGRRRRGDPRQGRGHRRLGHGRGPRATGRGGGGRLGHAPAGGPRRRRCGRDRRQRVRRPERDARRRQREPRARSRGRPDHSRSGWPAADPACARCSAWPRG